MLVLHENVAWAADPGGRVWIAEKPRARFVIGLPAAPAGAARARWIARGL